MRLILYHVEERRALEPFSYYFDAIQLRWKLQLDSNESFVYLLKNYGSCLSFLGRFDEWVDMLNEARDIADTVAEPFAEPMCILRWRECVLAGNRIVKNLRNMLMRQWR
jgi:hypothetical protein